jgi:DNA (cytosine-5)-methyltransferase 1
VETSSTIDATTPTPSKNQGGIAIAQPIAYENHPSDSRVKEMGDTCSTVTSKYGTGGGNTPLVAQPIPFRKAKRAQSKDDHETWEQDEKTNTLNAFDTGDIRTTQAVLTPIAVDTYNQTINEHSVQTIRSDGNHTDRTGAVLTPTIIDRAAFNQGQNAQYDIKIEEGQTMSSLVAKGPHGVGQHNPPTMAIRRLTPRECERLQGFPDDWTLIPYRNKSTEQCPDGPRYKACGNSMAVPCMFWLGKRIQMVEDILKQQNDVTATIPQL